jgi:L-fuconolactonase
VIVDAHHHLWDPAEREYPWLAGLSINRPYRVADLRDRVESAGVDRTVLVQTVSTVEETESFLALADANRDVVGGVVGWVDLTGADVAGELARLRSAAGGDLLVGIRHQAQDEADPSWLTRPDVVAGVRAVAAAGLVYDLLVLPHQLPAAVELTRTVADGRFVLDHLAKPLIAQGVVEPWASSVRQLGGLPNAACKVSGLVTEAGDDWSVGRIQPYVDVVVAAFGADRMMFGSDWPVCELVTGYGEVVRLARELCAGGGLSEGETAAVFGKTARDWYRLG